ncbi:hypothetical protein H072_3085 [Dactylellina haptotyla CBS 200.50]|uniref:Uncharacterized protein n=1 Tax=Dactylellina haptotyla (strain CBS 200.50) TaxID=1284197 RepID=S8C5K6_DACHA|nr:hypothetical protein H072_3085 [Dactylellina haptotyla CBS 200.50]
MGSSSKKKKEKQKDFVKPKLKVGKTKPKADNHTSTSFKSKAIVVGHQSLNAAAPTVQTQLKHNLTLLNHHAYSTRRDSLSHIASVLSSSSPSNPPISYSILLPALAPLILDSAAPVRTQLLTLFKSLTKSKDLRQDAIIPVDAVRMHTPRFLLYVHSAMTHISAEIRGDSTNFLAWLLDVVGEDTVRGAKGWGKTLKCWMVLLGWESGKSGTGIRTSTIEFSDPGKNKKAALQHLTVLKRFLSVGMLEDSAPASHFDIRMMDLLQPHQHTDLHLMPKTSNIYAHLSLFAASGAVENVSEEDAEGSAEDFDSRRRIMRNVFEENIRAGLNSRLQEAGEVGRLAGGVLKVMDKALKTEGPERPEETRDGIINFRDSLKPNDKQKLDSFSDPSADDVVKLVTDIDDSLQRKQKRRKLQSSAFMDFVRSVQQFGGIVDTTVQSNPEIAALVWGGVKFVLMAFLNHSKYLERITEMCEKMGRICPQYDRFIKLFPTHIELRSSVCEFYVLVVEFFKDAILFLYKSAIKQLAIATFNPFEERFASVIKRLTLIKETVDKEIYLASENELQLERINAAQARTYVKNFHNLAKTAFNDYQDDRIKLGEEYKRSKREKLLRNISEYPYHFDFADNLHKRLDKTGQWILQAPEYTSWLNSPNSSALWYHAIPGFGKSVLTAGIVDSLFEMSKTGLNANSTTNPSTRYYISYFFCTYTNTSSLNARTILSSLLHQLFYYSHALPKDLLDRLGSQFEDKASAGRVGIIDIQNLLIEIIKSNNACNFGVLDGIDECTDKKRGIVIRVLKQMLSSIPNNLKILLSSRGSQDIARALKEFDQIDLLASNQSDIEMFITQTLQDKELEGQLPELQPDLLDKIRATLAANAKGLFVWVDLQISEICNEANAEDIELALAPSNLPKDLNELYTRILRRILKFRRPEIAKDIFKWVGYALRPLTLDEIKEATIIDSSKIPDWPSLQKCTQMDDAKWIQNCENLVTLNKATKTIQFAHYTIKEFLSSGQLQKDPELSEAFYLDASEAHKMLGSACVAYFELPEIAKPSMNQQQAFIPKKEGESLNLVPQIVANSESSWVGWLARMVNRSPQQKADTKTSSMALIKSRNTAALIVSQKESFKKMLQRYPLLEYATSNWLLHYDRVFAILRESYGGFNTSLPSGISVSVPSYSDGRENRGYLWEQLEFWVLNQVKVTFTVSIPVKTSVKEFGEAITANPEVIRFPWQSYFVPDPNNTEQREERLFKALDWALDNNVYILFAIIYACLYPKEASLLPDYWFNRRPTVDVLRHYRQGGSLFSIPQRDSRFDILCHNSNSFQSLWVFAVLSFRQDLKSMTYIHKEQIYTLMPYACESGDLALLEFLGGLWLAIPGAADGTKNVTIRTETFAAMMCGAITADSLEIVDKLLTDDLLSIFTRNIEDIVFENTMPLIPALGNARMFKHLMDKWRDPFKKDGGSGPDIARRVLLAVAESGCTEMMTACFEKTGSSYRQNQPFYLDRVLITAVAHNHLDLVKLIAAQLRIDGLIRTGAVSETEHTTQRLVLSKMQNFNG